MRYEEIEKLIEKSKPETQLIKISFKKRESLKGIFIKTSDYSELSRKNLWRIVTEYKLDAYNESHDENLARIFNGVEFTRLELMLS